jgi:hypothetical protein
MENLMVELSSLTAQRLLLWVTAIDVLLVGGLAAIVLLSGRMRSRALAAQRATLERLRAGLAELVSDAEHRAHDLESALGAREERLRALLDEIARVESAARAPARPQPGRAAKPAAVAEDAPPARQTGFDPAEDRLLRELGAAHGAADGRALRLDRPRR